MYASPGRPTRDSTRLASAGRPGGPAPCAPRPDLGEAAAETASGVAGSARVVDMTTHLPTRYFLASGATALTAHLETP